MTRLPLLLLLLLLTRMAAAQVNDNFSDGDFTDQPAWTGATASWTVNAALQLQSQNTTANSSFYLSTANTLAIAVQWEFYVRLAFNTSSANYADVFLTASAADVTLNSTTGYFVRIGNTQDEVALYRKDAGGSITKLIDGADGITNTNDNQLRIRVTRSSNGTFTLMRDVTATGNNYLQEGKATDATYTTSSFFGIWIKQSTSSFFGKHYFDDIEVSHFVPDITPPTIQSISISSPSSLSIVFSEPVELAAAQTLSHYTVNGGIGMPLNAQRDAANNALVHLTFAGSFINRSDYTLTINGVQDLSGNVLTNGAHTFSYFIPQRFDVIIHEVFADPSPTIGLPAAKYIEIKNTSGKTINLLGWKLSSSTSASNAFPSYSLPADSLLILTSTTNAALLSPFGRVLGIPGFPAMDIDGTTLSLTSKEGATIHAVAYDKSWYGNTIKREGGWSLEMIDAANPCTGKGNWKASIHERGGTPGQKNSITGTITDMEPPQLLRTYTLDSTTLVALFSEPLDSLSASVSSHYNVSNGFTILSAIAQPPLFNSVVLKLSAALQPKTIHTLTTKEVRDCKGNTIGAFNHAKVGLPEIAAAMDIVINEILFNPRPTASDYVEVYNKSNKVIDASSLYLSNRNSAGAIGTLHKINETHFFIFPDDYLVITEDAAALQQEYLVHNPINISTLPSMPSLPNDKGTVVLINRAGSIIDEVAYTHKWHFALISNTEGIALERIDPNALSQDAGNWHSAASTAGYGTPTYKNSQAKAAITHQATITVSPKTFSPDNDGRDDITTIAYQVEATGYIANVTIFDAGGRPVRYLVKNGLLGKNGSWNWDGVDEKGQKLPIGTYVIFTELFNANGKKQQVKNTVVLARHLR